MRPYALFVLAVIAASPATARAQSRPDSVSLRFGWPAGASARVDQEWSRVQVTPARRDSIGVRSRYRLLVRAHPEGRLVQSDSFVITSASPANAPSQAGAAEAQQLIARLGSFQPSYVVSAEGEFVRLEGAERTKRLLDSLFAPLMRDMAGAPSGAREMFSSLSSPAVLTAAAAQDWNSIAGTWIGANWEVGEWYGTEQEELSPMFPGLEIPMQYEFSAAERVPCSAGESARRCVRLEMVSAPDSAALRTLVGDFLARLAPDQKALLANLQSMRTTSELTVITDPRDLRPYEVTLVKRVDVSVAPAAGEPGGATTRIDTRRARYSWSP